MVEVVVEAAAEAAVDGSGRGCVCRPARHSLSAASSPSQAAAPPQVKRWQEKFYQTGVLRLGHPRGNKAVTDDLKFNRTPFTLDGAALTVHLMPRVFNSLWHLAGRNSHPCECDQKTGCATRQELDRCPRNKVLTGESPFGGYRVPTAIVTTFWTSIWTTTNRAAKHDHGGARLKWNRSAALVRGTAVRR